MPTARVLVLAMFSCLSLLACGQSASTPAAGTKADAGKDSGRAADAAVSTSDAAGDAAPSNADGPPSPTDAASLTDTASPADALGASDAAGSDGSSSAAAFLGEWDYDSGQAVLACPSATALTQDLAGTFLTFEAGSGGAPLSLTSPDCTLRFGIKGQIASVLPGQSCMNPVAGRAATSVPTAFAFTLDGAGAMQTSTWTVTFAAAPTAPCSLTAQGHLTHKP